MIVMVLVVRARVVSNGNFKKKQLGVTYARAKVSGVRK